MELDAKYYLILYALVFIAVGMVVLTLLFFLRNLSNKAQHKQIAILMSYLKNAQDELASLDRMKSSFINSITHEIRTPLNSINGFSSLLANNLDSLSQEERKSYVRAIRKSSDELASLIDDLVNLSSLTDNSIIIHKGDVFIGDIISDVVSRAQPRPGVEMKKIFYVSSNFIVNTDSTIVSQILMDLVGNACKFTYEGHVEVACNLVNNGHTLRISVSDTGPGIPVEKQEFIFQRFAKINEFNQGNGLGLYVSKKLAKVIKGDLTLDSSYTGGARFLLDVPVIEPEETA